MTQTSPDLAIMRERALALHRSGSVLEAAHIYKAALKLELANADILGLLALAQHQLGSHQLAKDLWLKSLSHGTAPPILLRNLNNFLTALLQEGASSEFPLLKELGVPDWPEQQEPNPGERSMIISLARGLTHIGRQTAALNLLESALPQLAGNAGFIKDASEILLEAGHAERAMLLLQPLTAKDNQTGTGGALLITHAAVAFSAGYLDDAFTLTARAIDALPVIITAKSASQIMLVGVLNVAPKLIQKPISAEGLHFFENSPASLARSFKDDYQFMSIFPEARAVKTALQSLPRPDIILNNWVNAEALSTPNTLKFIAGFADSLGIPVLNHPRKAAETTRQRNAERLKGIAHLVVPRIMRFINEAGTRKAAIRLIRDTIGFPVIIRDPFLQMGKEAAKLDTPRQLEKYLNQIPGQELYGIEYVHNPAEDGIYRKIRAAIIGDEIFISHVHFGQQWNVHRERDEGKLAELNLKRSTLQFADKIISDPVSVLGKPGMAVLAKIRSQISLEFFGMDFDIMPDGQLLFFEANAAMNIGMSGRKGLEESRMRMRQTLNCLFRKAMGQ